MQYRNAQWNGLGGIDCEINHPQFGWIPFTASPDDVEEYGREIFAAIKAAGLPKTAQEKTSATKEG